MRLVIRQASSPRKRMKMPRDHQRRSDLRDLTLSLIIGALLLLPVGCGGEADALPKGRSLSARWSITPPVALFGDPIRARVSLLINTDELDPDFIQVDPDFTPYERLGAPAIERRDFGRFTFIRYQFTLRCITIGCIKLIGGGPQPPQPGGIPPPTTGSGGFGERKSIRLKPTAIRYEDQDGRARVLRTLSWPEVQSVSRLNFADTQTTGIGFPFRAEVTPLPEATFHVAPGFLGVGLIGGALALLAFPAVVFGRALRREPPPVEAPEDELTPLERALALVEWARDRPDVADRRKALEVLARHLETDGGPALAKDARRLAWSRAAPLPEAVDRIVEVVRERDGSSV